MLLSFVVQRVVLVLFGRKQDSICCHGMQSKKYTFLFIEDYMRLFSCINKVQVVMIVW